MGCACTKTNTRITQSVVKKPKEVKKQPSELNQGKKRNSVNLSTLESELNYNQKHLDSEEAISIEEDWSILVDMGHSKERLTPSIAADRKRIPFKKVDPLHQDPRFNLNLKFSTCHNIRCEDKTGRVKLPKIAVYRKACSKRSIEIRKSGIEINQNILSSSNDSSFEDSEEESSKEEENISGCGRVYRRKRKILTSIFNEDMHGEILNKSMRQDEDGFESKSNSNLPNVLKTIAASRNSSRVGNHRVVKRTERRCMTTRLPPLFNKSFRPSYKVNLLSKLAVGQSSFTPYAGLRPVRRSHQALTFSQYVDQVDSRK